MHDFSKMTLAYSVKNLSLRLHRLNQDWVCYPLWPIERGGGNSVLVLTQLLRWGMLLLPLWKPSLHHEKKPGPSCWRMRLTGGTVEPVEAETVLDQPVLSQPTSCPCEQAQSKQPRFIQNSRTALPAHGTKSQNKRSLCCATGLCGCLFYTAVVLKDHQNIGQVSYLVRLFKTISVDHGLTCLSMYILKLVCQTPWPDLTLLHIIQV